MFSPKYFVLGSLLLISLGCATVATTGTRGINFGMSPELVQQELEKKAYTIVSHDNNMIVAKGVQEQTEQPAIKVFEFERNKLVSVSDKVLDGKGKTYKYVK